VWCFAVSKSSSIFKRLVNLTDGALVRFLSRRSSATGAATKFAYSTPFDIFAKVMAAIFAADQIRKPLFAYTDILARGD
jgi:hypothetical protein